MAAQVRPGYRHVLSTREPLAKLEIYESETKSVQFFDGIGSVAIGTAVSRLQLFTVTSLAVDQGDPSGMPIETRSVDQELVIPTMSLLESAANILAGFSESKDAISGNTAQLIAKIEGIVKQIKST